MLKNIKSFLYRNLQIDQLRMTGCENENLKKRWKTEEETFKKGIQQQKIKNKQQNQNTFFFIHRRKGMKRIQKKELEEIIDAKLAASNEKITNLNGLISSMKSSHETEITNLNGEITKLHQQITTHQKKISDMEPELAELRKDKGILFVRNILSKFLKYINDDMTKNRKEIATKFDDLVLGVNS